MVDTCTDLPMAGAADVIIVLWFSITGVVMVFGKIRTTVASTRLVPVIIPLVAIMLLAFYMGSLMCDPTRCCCSPTNEWWYAWAPAIVGLCFYTFIHVMRLVQPSLIFSIVATGWALVFPVASYFKGMSGPTAFAIGVAVFFDWILAGIKKFVSGNPVRAKFEDDRTAAYQKCNRGLRKLRCRLFRGNLSPSSYKTRARELKETRNREVRELKCEYKARKSNK